MNTTIPSFQSLLGAFITRQGLTDTAAAALLGVPVFTLKKWQSGTRKPSAAVFRLLEVLSTLEAIAPDILAHLTPESRHVEKSESVGSTN